MSLKDGRPPIVALPLDEFMRRTVSPEERRRELFGAFEARPNYGLAVRLWAAYALATDLFDGTAGPLPPHVLRESAIFARRATEFFESTARAMGIDETEWRAARDEGLKLAETIQRQGLPGHLR